MIQHIKKVVNPLGVKDTVTTKYMRQNEIFADAFNYFVYGGEQVCLLYTSDAADD